MVGRAWIDQSGGNIGSLVLQPLIKKMKKSDINPMPKYFDRYINLVADVEILIADYFTGALVNSFIGNSQVPSILNHH
jgi:hypothetical protein